MNVQTSPENISRSAVAAEERLVREDLAALYHVFFDLGWCEHIYNHITARVPGPDKHFLINSFGLAYNEVTASNLIKIDLDGHKVVDLPGRVNAPGFTIHSSVHAARDDAHFIAHTHTTAGVAVACTEEGSRITPLRRDALWANCVSRFRGHFDGSRRARASRKIARQQELHDPETSWSSDVWGGLPPRHCSA